ncbi:biotin/lipoyl-containing protein, partial [Cellulosimicrobium cellulans]|uniref:biotin/lipoyl-containing protein n=1 Tax=Cellulosimicrobium cellulans TaxID=1710 RepID=UPI000AE92842
MSENVQMPALGESVTEGTVTRWLKSVGDTVEVDEPLLEVSTDKVDTEIPSPVAGVLEQILVQEDETVEVGANLAVVGSGEGAGSAAPAPAEEPQQAQPEAPAEQGPAPAEEAPAPAEQPAPAADSAPAGGGGEEIKLPALGESVTEGTVTRWLKSVGDTVEVDEPLLEVSTDKVDTEVPSPVAGTVQQILVQEDETVEVGANLAIVGSGAPAAEAPAQQREEPAEQRQEPAEQPAPEAEPVHGVAAT